MTPSGIFLIRQDAPMVVLQQEPYESEDLLQRALATYPDVLAGGVTGSEGQARLLLVRREMGVPTSDAGGTNWSVDHLFLDAEGVPVVVEVKRASDTRIRREVVGQMLDYAANALRYWPVTSLRVYLEEAASQEGKTAEELVRELRPEMEPEEFWDAVEANLDAGHIRMVFVADELPDKLVRIIEFLNEQMSPGEVLGVEVPQFVGEGLQLLVPRLRGDTAAAAATKNQTSGVRWNEESFLETARETCTDQETALLERLFAHVKEHGERFSWGRGRYPGVSGWYQVGGEPIGVWTTNTRGSDPYIFFYLPQLRERMARDDFERLTALLASIPALRPKIEDARAAEFEGKHPQLNLEELTGDESASATLFEALGLIPDKKQ